MNWPDEVWTIAPPLIKPRRNQNVILIHFIQDQNTCIRFVLDFTLLHRFDWTGKVSIDVGDMLIAELMGFVLGLILIIYPDFVNLFSYNLEIDRQMIE